MMFAELLGHVRTPKVQGQKHFFWKSKIYALVQCLHSIELQRYQVGETSHLLVKHRVFGNTKLNFDIGRVGLCIHDFILRAGHASCKNCHFFIQRLGTGKFHCTGSQPSTNDSAIVSLQGPKSFIVLVHNLIMIRLRLKAHVFDHATKKLYIINNIFVTCQETRAARNDGCEQLILFSFFHILKFFHASLIAASKEIVAGFPQNPAS